MAGSIFTVAEFNRAQALVAKMLGVGEGDYGYNQSTINSTQANPEFTVSDAIALRKDILMLTYHQVGPTWLSTQPTKSIPEITNNQLTAAISDKILLATLGARLSDQSLPAEPNGWLLAGRTNMYQKTRVIRNTISTITMTEDWNTTSTHTFTVTFEDADAMRCYFNAGSTIEITPSKSGTTSTQNSKWVTLFASVGTLTFQRNNTAVSKTKITTKWPGYSSAATANEGITIFTTSTTSSVYKVTAVISGTNSIIFTSTFSNTGPNVTGVLTTTVKSYHAVRLEGDDLLQYIDIPEPSCESSHIIGDPNPSFSITRSPALSQLNETGKSNNIAYTFYATNFTGDTVYYTIVKDIISKPPSASDIIIEDFIDRPLSDALTLVTTGSSKSVTLNITIAADANTEGLDKFNIEFRATDDADDLVLISVKSAFGKTVNISDTSPTPKVLARTLRFGAVTTGKIPTYTVGTKVVFSIFGTNVVVPNDLVTWKIRTVTGTARDLTADDFQEGLEGDFKMPANQKYNLELNITDDAKFDALEKFIVDLYLSDPVSKEVLAKPAASSYVVQITSTVEIAQVPYVVLPPSALTMEENGKVGISIPFTTPYLAPTAAKVWYWITTADSENGISAKNKIEATDFTDKTIKGVCPVTVKGNAGSGTLKKIAAADSAIEGTEGFIVTFYKDKDYTDSFGKTETIRITETVGYTVDVSSRSMSEPLPTGTTSTGKLPYFITFTLKTPYIENDPPTSVHWEVIPISPAPSGGIGTFTENDFEEGINGDTPVVDNKVILKLTANNDGITEGVEQFYVRFTLTVNGVLITKDSPTVSVTETVKYSIARTSNSQSIVAEQPTGTTEGFEYTIKTPYLPPNTPIYWEVIPADKTSVLEKTDFTIGQYSGQIIINQNGAITNEATLSLVPVVDTKIEGSESFYVIVKTTPSKSSEVARTLQADTISEDFKPTIYVASKSLTEGATGLNFNIAVPKNPIGTKVFWKITKGTKGTITDSDFLVSDAVGKNRQATSGNVRIDKNSTAVLSIAARQDAVAISSTGTEDEERFIVSIGMDETAIDAKTDELSITDISSYIVTTDVTSVVETEGSLLGSKSRTVNFGVYTPYFVDGRTLYYTVKSVAGTVNDADFVLGNAQGTFNVYNNYQKLTFKMKDDMSTAEGNEKFYIEIRETGYTSPVVKGGISPGVLIYDTSVNNGTPIDDTEITATITSLDNKMEYTEGDTMNLRITTEGVLTSDDLNWSILSYVSGGIGQYLSAVESAAPFRVTGSITAGSITLPPITVTITAPNEGYRVFIFQVHKGSVATDPIGFAPFAIKDKVAYSVEPTGTLISESGNTGTRFNVVTPAESYNSTLKWRIEAEGLGIDATDFNVPSQYNFNSVDNTGDVIINANGTGYFTLSAATDAVTESTESFRIKLLKSLGVGLGWALIPNVQSSIVNISDLTNYTLTWTADGKIGNTVPAGNLVTYTLTTPKLVAASMSSPWKVNKTGAVSAVTVITPPSIAVNESTTSYTFTLNTSSSITSDLSFNVDIVKSNSAKVNPVLQPPDVTVIAPEVYSIVAKNSSGVVATTISENDSIDVLVQSASWPIYVYIVQLEPEELATTPIDALDFTRPQIQKLAWQLNQYYSTKTSSCGLTFGNPTNRVTNEKKFRLLLSTQPPGTPIQIPTGAAVKANTPTITKQASGKFTISVDTKTVNSGSPVTFTVTSPTTNASNVTYRYEIVGLKNSAYLTNITHPGARAYGGVTKANNYGEFTIAANATTGTFTITVPAVAANQLERTYQVTISTSTDVILIPPDTTGSVNPIISVTTDGTYSITSNPNGSVTEGSSVMFTIKTPDIGSSNATYVCEVVPFIGSDITNVVFASPATQLSNLLKATFTVNATSKSGTVTITVPTTLTVDTRKYTLKIYTQYGTEVVTSEPITVTSDGTYSISATPESVTEGSSVTFNIKTPNIGNKDLTYNWQVVPIGSGISSVTATSPTKLNSTNPLTGTFIVNAASKSGTVTITVPPTTANDTRQYQLKVSDNSSVVVIPIDDGTKNPIITVGSSGAYLISATVGSGTNPVTTVMEGDLLTFKITRPDGQENVTTLGITAIAVDNVSDFIATTHIETITGTHKFSQNVYTFTVKTKIDLPANSPTRKNNSNRKFKIALTNKTTATATPIDFITQSDITITDYEYLSVTDNGVIPAGGNSPVIREGNTGTGADAQLPNSVTFTVIAKPADLNTKLNYEITGTAGVKPEKFEGTPPLKGTTTTNVTLNSTGQYAGLYTVDFTLTTVADSITNIPANNTFSVKFTRSGIDTGSSATNACISRTISIKDTSTTVIPAAYLITDTGFPQTGSSVSINEGNVITFTVDVRDGDTGQMYYSIRPAASNSIKAADLIKAGETVALTLLEGSIPISNGYAILTLTTVLNNADNTSSKGFFVVFSTTALTATSTQVDKNLISRSVTIVDTSKTPVLVSTIQHTLNYSPPGCYVLPGYKFYVESKITPITAATPMTWRISGDKSVLAKIKYNNLVVDSLKTYTATSKSTNRLGTPEASCHFLSLEFSVDSVTASEDVCGVFTITFSVTQIGVEKTVSATINLSHNQLAGTKKITSNMLYPLANDILGIDYMSVKLAGGGGGGGGTKQGSGAPGDIVTGLIPAQPLFFRFIPGAPGGLKQTANVKWTIYEGSSGGNAVAVYSNRTSVPSDSVAPLATAAGGGGAGTEWGGDEAHTWNGKPTTVTTIYNPECVTSPDQPVSGCGGSGGGTSTKSTRQGGDDDDSRLDQPGGYGGKSFVPAPSSWNRKASSNSTGAYAEVSFYKKCGTASGINVPTELVTSGEFKVTVPEGVTSADVVLVGGGGGGGAAGGTSVTPTTTQYTHFSTTNLMKRTIVSTSPNISNYYVNEFGIYGGPNSVEFSAEFRTPALAPATYNLFYHGRGFGDIIIDKKTYSFTMTTDEPVFIPIQITSTFTRIIKVSAKLNPFYVTRNALTAEYISWQPSPGPAGIGAWFNITIIATGYTVTVGGGGTGYRVGDGLKISGDKIMGNTPANDITIEIATVDSKGKITKITSSGASLKNYCVAAWITPDGGTVLREAEPVATGSYGQVDILWSTRSPANLITKTSGIGASNGSSGGGGGGGSVVSARIPVTSGETLTVNVGDGGEGGKAKSDLGNTSTQSTNGISGEATTISRGAITVVSASGGAGGSTFTSGAAAGGSGGTVRVVPSNVTDNGSIGNPGMSGVFNKTTSVRLSKGGIGGINTSSYGIGGVGGDLIETTQDTTFLPGQSAGNGYVSISWGKGAVSDYGCTPTVATVNTESITSIDTKWSHYANGEGQVTLKFTDNRWTTTVASYNVWCTSSGLGAGYPSSEYLLTKFTPSSNSSTTTKSNIWVTTFTGTSSNLTKITLRIEALNSSNARLYEKTLEKVFTSSSFSTSNDEDHVYTFTFS